MTATIPDQATQTAAERRVYIIAECDHAVFMGESLYGLSHRLGYTAPPNLAKSLHKWGRDDLAERISQRKAAA